MILQRKTQDDYQLFLKNGRAMKPSLALLMTGFRWKEFYIIEMLWNATNKIRIWIEPKYWLSSKMSLKMRLRSSDNPRTNTMN